MPARHFRESQSRKGTLSAPVNGLRLGTTTLAATVVLAACGGEEPTPRWEAPAGLTRAERSLPACEVPTPVDAVEVEEIVGGLEVPWDLNFLPDGRVLVVERAGRIRVVEDGELRPEPWATFDVRAIAEAGLLGIAVDPDFDTNGHVYVMGTFVDASLGARVGRALGGLFDADAGNAWRNRVLRLTDQNGSGVEATVLIDGLASGPIHAGGGLRFGPDGMLYFGLGEGSEPRRAGDPDSDGGKIHRFDPHAPDPSASLETWAMGFRNPQSFDWSPTTGELVTADHGPSGLETEGRRAGGDELNVVVQGGDYGWPDVSGSWDGATSIAPIAEWTPAVAPGGMAFVDDTASVWHGSVVMTGLVSQKFVRVDWGDGDTLTEAAAGACTEEFFLAEYGRLRAMRSGPDGALWFTTSNRDQRGSAREGDDRLLRLVPPRP